MSGALTASYFTPAPSLPRVINHVLQVQPKKGAQNACTNKHTLHDEPLLSDRRKVFVIEASHCCFSAGWSIWSCSQVCELAPKIPCRPFARAGIHSWHPWLHSLNLKPTHWMAIPQCPFCPASLHPTLSFSLSRPVSSPGWIVGSIVSVRCLLMRGMHTEQSCYRRTNH